MPQDASALLRRMSGKVVRQYSTFDFGREQDPTCLSVVVPKEKAKGLVLKLRKALPRGQVAFMGTTRWLGDERHEGAEVVVGKGESQFDILRLARSDACNYDLGTEDLVKKLNEYHDAFGIDVFHAETDTIEFDFVKRPKDLGAFARDLYAFCPDIVDQGVGSVEALEQALDFTGSVYLWWD